VPEFLFAKQSFYKAEAEAWTQFPERNKLTSLLSCQRYINRITRTWWFNDNFGFYQIKVVDAPKSWGQDVAAADTTNTDFLIRVSQSMRNRFTMLHELAHIVSRMHGHGQLFIKNYLKLVKKFNPRVYKELRKQFRRIGIMVP
jgi:Zn-dependent peptidase ImmA (M78 family)